MLPIFSTLLKFIPKRRKLHIGLLTLITLFSSMLEIFSIGALFPFISIFIDSSFIFENEYVIPILDYFKITSADELYFPVTVGFLVIASISYIFKLLLIFLRSNILRKISQELSTLIYWKIIHENYQFHTNQNTSDIITALTQSSLIVTKLLLPVLKMINSSFLITFALLGVLIINPYLTLIIITSLSVFYSIVTVLVNNRLKRYSTIQNKNYSNLIKLIQESLGAIKIILLNNTQNIFHTAFNKNIGEYFKSFSMVQLISQIPKLIFEYIILFIIVLITYNSDNEQKIVDLFPLIITFIYSIQRLSPEFGILYRSVVNLKSNSAILNRNLNYLKINDESPLKKQKQKPTIEFKKRLVLKDIFFKYVQEDINVLSDINLNINKGDCVGIVGKTGSGKSTLIDLISGLISPNSGQIIVDDIPLDSTNIQGWKDKISLVSQDIFLFDATIEENIAFNGVDKKIDYEKLKEVCKMVELNAFIDSQPNGYQSKIGEKGIRISGGQMQRIGIARALYNQLEVLILDEATSALDEDTERKVMKNIIDYSQNLTLIIIAHRLTTLKQCNKIFKVETNGLKVFAGYTALIKNQKIEE